MNIPPFDPELAPVLAASPIPSTITADMIGLLRAAPFTPPIGELIAGRSISHSEHVARGPGGPITVSRLAPAGLDAPAPGIVFLHGGGMIIGDRFTGIAPVLDWVDEFGLVALSVEYRLAPEHPAPAAVDDVDAVLRWAAAAHAELGIDPDRLLIAGTSAGGGIAAAATLRARDERGPALVAQMLMSPMLDDRNDTVSAQQYEDLGSWSRTSNLTGWTASLGDRRGTDGVGAYDAAARAVDVGGLPSTFIDVGSAEVFRDEDVAYASRLWAAGVDAELHVWAGGFHIFDGIAPAAAVSVAAVEARRTWLRRILARLSDGD